jgi:sarcosine oxidase, subunit alpha
LSVRDHPTMGVLSFEGKDVQLQNGDTVASALFRAGIRTFSRSLKYHRRRGLYCLTGDCPNCLLNIDGGPAMKACCTEARDGAVVRRETGWPSAEHDLLALNDRLHWALPVGFYYKTFLRPRWAWPRVERVIRLATGLGAIDLTREPVRREQLHHHSDLLVVGAGVAGLAAALEAARIGDRVILCDQTDVGTLVASPGTRTRINTLLAAVRKTPAITLLERAPAIGVYEGPLVPLNGPDFLHIVHPRRIVVATGAVESHPAMSGNDLPGVFLSRGAALLASRHDLAVGRRIAAVGASAELAEHVELLTNVGASVIKLDEDDVVRIEGRRRVEHVMSRTQRIGCDAVVFALPRVPRDSLLRQAGGLPVTGAGEAVEPGCSLGEAEASGRRAGAGADRETRASDAIAPQPRGGFVCLCEDVTVPELEHAWYEGYRSTELLKRYTTITMGPCQGLLCQQQLRSFVVAQGRNDAASASATTSRPPGGLLTLEDAAAGLADEPTMRTRLHARHLAAGAVMEPTGGWLRPSHYGDVTAEYTAVRERVSLMDVGTLGKFLVAGRDAGELLERLYPSRIADIAPGRLRYALLLSPTGFVIDDGTICALEGGGYYLTFTSVGAAAAESILKDWADTWQLSVHIVNLTVARGAINVVGPRARELLAPLTDGDLSNGAFPYLHHGELPVAGVRCRILRLGFLGELSYELHHPSRSSPELWDALARAGDEFGLRPHGLEALRLLRLEKGHIMIGQDTDYDTTPMKLGLDWAVRLDKPRFVGKAGLQRAAAQPMSRRLAPIAFAGDQVPAEGSALTVAGRYVGHLTSSRFSPTLGHGIGLGWIDCDADGAFPASVQAGGISGTVVSHAFYDPDGERLRA